MNIQIYSGILKVRGTFIGSDRRQQLILRAPGFLDRNQNGKKEIYQILTKKIICFFKDMLFSPVHYKADKT
jgi:hypothetical protein